MHVCVKNFVNLVCKELNMKIIWKGKGLKEKAYYKNKAIVSIDKKYFRPTEVDSLLGDSSMARRELKWKPKHNIQSLARDMVNEELKSINADKKR